MVVLAPAVPAAPAAPVAWWWRLREALSAYLPLLLMALLALGTWWLVKNTPAPDAAPGNVALRHEPDYTMHDFMVQRFAPDGRLRVQLEGSLLRHYPDTDTIEVDEVRLRALSPEGGVTTATARRALSNGDASEVQLLGGAHVVSQAQPEQPEIEFNGEFLHAFLATEQLRSHLPVVVRRAGTELRADTLAYDNLARVAQLKGHVQARLTPQPPAATTAPRAPQRKPEP
jgi:lipopolysaccharide export system protein LptC